MLHELVWHVTLSSPTGEVGGAVSAIAAPSSSDSASAASAFPSASRALVLDLLRRHLDVSSNPLAPSLSQVALVDALWQVWTGLEKLKRDEAIQQQQQAATSAAATADATMTAPEAAPSRYTLAKDRVMAFVTEVQQIKKAATSAGASPAASPSSMDEEGPLVALLNARALRETLQPDFLDALGVFGAAQLAKQAVTTRTTAWYRQQKFNLLREESEGFSKLFTELSTFFQLSSTQVSAALMQRKVWSFIGFFDLDPNRVIDVLLDSFERSGALATPSGQLANFLHLIDGFETHHVAQILGFKFRNYYEASLATAAAAAQAATATATKSAMANSIGNAPQSLYDIAAILIKTGRISIEALYSHVSHTSHATATMHCTRVRLCPGQAAHPFAFLSDRFCVCSCLPATS